MQSPLTDSNRRPPPHHRNRWQRFWLVRDDDFTDRAESVEEERPASPAAAPLKITGEEEEADNDATESEGGAWPGGIAAITLFEDDLEAAKRFYQEVFRLPIHFEDENSAVFKFGETLVNLLSASEASELVEPAKVAAGDAGVRFQFTVGVDGVDAMCEELRRRGATILNGPMERPWGIRTASFRDPGGHIWEIAK